MDGNRSTVHGSCVVPLNIDGKIFNYRVYALGDITTEAPLGLNFLELHQCSVNAGKKTLAFSESGTEVLLQKGDDAETIHSIDRNLLPCLKYTVSATNE